MKDRQIETLQAENAQLRQMIRELILTEQTRKSLWPGEEGCPVLDLPHPCTCGNVIIERFLFKPDTFRLTYPDNTAMKVEGTLEAVSLHDIDFRDGIVCRKCGHKLVRKWESTD